MPRQNRPRPDAPPQSEAQAPGQRGPHRDGPQPDDPGTAARRAGRVRLRLLATSDLHLCLTSTDPLTGRRAPGAAGLARLGRLIARARAEQPNCLLFDSGDFLQGSLSEILGGAILGGVRHPQRHLAPHPMIAAMNLLGYDAATLGNHDFDPGLAFLGLALAEAGFPIVGANLRPAGKGPLAGLIRPSVMMQRQVLDDEGRQRRLRIGVTGAAPAQTARWSRFALGEGLLARPILPALADEVAALRAAGADVVVVLCHSGTGELPPPPEAEHVARAVSLLPGVDAVLAGHSHEVFARPASEAGMQGEPRGAALVVPGAMGSHLGVVDLVLDPRAGGGLGAVGGSARALCARTAAPGGSDARITRMARRTMRAARAICRAPAGEVAVPLRSHFANLAPDLAARLMAEAAADAARRALAGGPQANLPVLATAAPFGASGGRAVLDLPAGSLSMGDLHRICPFVDTLVVLEMTGAGIRGWLEQAARGFARLTPGLLDQPLLVEGAHPHLFDLIEGVECRIHLDAPPGHRIGEILLGGRALADTDRVALATNSYRAGGGGGFAIAEGAPILLADPTPLRQHLARHLARCGPWQPAPTAPWSFAPLPGTAAHVRASAEAVALVRQGAGPAGVHPAPPSADGTPRLRLHL